jgi:hypothetical protein
VGRVSGFQREGLGPSEEAYFVCSSRFQPWAKDSYTALTRDTREIFYTCSSCIVLHCGYDEQRYPFLGATGSFITMYISAIVARLDRKRGCESEECAKPGLRKGKNIIDIRNAQLLLGLHGTRLGSHTQYKMQIRSNQGCMFKHINSISTPNQISPSPLPSSPTKKYRHTQNAAHLISS